MDFVDLIIAVHDHLDRAQIAHAFGGPWPWATRPSRAGPPTST